MGTHLFLFLQLEVEKGASIGGCPMFNFFDDVPFNMVSFKKNEHIHELINMNHIMSLKNGACLVMKMCDEINICTLKDYHPMCPKTNLLATSFFVRPPNLTRLPIII